MYWIILVQSQTFNSQDEQCEHHHPASSNLKDWGLARASASEVLHSPSTAGTNHMPFSKSPSLWRAWLRLDLCLKQVDVLAVMTQRSLSTIHPKMVLFFQHFTHFIAVKVWITCWDSTAQSPLHSHAVLIVFNIYLHVCLCFFVFFCEGGD